ncbi:MAG: hypothetical protein WB680_22605 [Candidatus Acidiferrales bacterium]
MKKIKYDPKLPTLGGDGCLDGGLPTFQQQADEALRAAAKPHAIEALVRKTKFKQTYRIDDGSLLQIDLRTMVVTRL